jgi:beta-fructofuranosidase
MVVDTRAASLNAAAAGGVYSMPARPDASGQVRLHIFLDRSVLEVFTGEGDCLAARIYPTRDDSLGLSGFCQGGVQLQALDVWQVNPLWQD